MDIEGRVAVVTGGGSGIGRATCVALAAAGAQVVVADIDGAAAEAVTGELIDTRARALAVRTDVTSDADVEALRDRTLAELGGVDIVVANAGVLLEGGITSLGTPDWEWLYGVNVIGVVRTIYAFLPALIAQGSGHIVITGSINSLGGAGVYGTSKAALLHLGESLRDELQPVGIGVSVTLPVRINSRITSSQRSRPDTFGRHAPAPSAALTEFGIDAAFVGERTVLAIRHGELYVPVFPAEERQRFVDPLQRRLAGITASLDAGSVTATARSAQRE